MPAYRLAHLTDLHATEPRLAPAEWTAKRALGLLSWHVKRRAEHRPEILAAAVADLRSQQADHVAITGDLTNLGTAAETETALRWLESLGPPSEVSLVPGNHDAYATGSEGPGGWRRWRAYIASDVGAARAGRKAQGDAPGLFPAVRLRGPLALVGLCSVHPTGVFLAHGDVGDAQIEALEATLASLGAEGWCRVLLIHHDPVPGSESPRRRLRDGEALCDAIGRAGAELVLHGHTHRDRYETIPGPRGPVPVVGGRSASARGRKPEKQARYHVYRFERAKESWRIGLDVRAFDGTKFTDGGSRALA